MAGGVYNFTTTAGVPARLNLTNFSSFLKSQDKTIAQRSYILDWCD